MTYHLAHATATPSSSGYPATLKASFASTIFSVPLRAATSTNSTPSAGAAGGLDAFLHGPALLLSDNGGGGQGGQGREDVIAFGGNAIVRALSLLSSSSGSSGGSSRTNNLEIDSWLEFERTVLRPALRTSTCGTTTTATKNGTAANKNAKKNVKKVDGALAKLEDALSTHGNLHLVGSDMTAADICVLVTLYLYTTGSGDDDDDGDGVDGDDIGIIDLSQGGKGGRYPVLSRYLATHTTSPDFTLAISQIPKSLIPPPPFDYQSDPSLIRAVDSVLSAAVRKSFPAEAAELGEEKLRGLVAKCKDVAKHGDYQCNAAMPIFQIMSKNAKSAGAGGGGGGGLGGSSPGSLPAGINSPQDVARSIIASIPPSNPILDPSYATINGPGFIMVRIRSTYLRHHIQTLISTGSVPKPHGKRGGATIPEIVCVDFSSPNIAKEMHVGHLRSTIIGESVCRVLEFANNDVHRINHVGDWGTQFGMLIQYLREEYPDFAENVPNITDLTVFYKNAKSRFDEDEEFKEISRLNVVKLQSGDRDCLDIWNILCDVSRKEFEKVYARLDITVEECGESFYNDKIPAVVKEFEDAGLISVEEGGAKCVFVPKYKIPLMLQKSDGGYGYDSTDMAAMKYRLSELGATRLVYITDYGQADHFKMCFLAADKIQWLEKGKHRLEHIGFGTVMGEDGKRFKTRSGDTVRLVDLLDEAVTRMEDSLNERIKEGKANISPEEVHETASALGYGAVRYFDLRRNPTTNYKFSYDEMLDTRGNTAIYLLYAHARLESICSKGRADFDADVDELVKNSGEIVLGHPSERNLALHLQMFADTIESTLDDLFPYHICDFLYALSNAVSDFVTKCKVLGSPEMESRLLLCRATAIVMRQCFELLGIRPVMRI